MRWLRGPACPVVGLLVSGLCLWGSDLGFSDPLPFPAQERTGAVSTGSVSPIHHAYAGTARRCEEPHFYDLRMHLEVDGRIKMLSRTRYYRSADLHLKFEARTCPEGWAFRSLGLAQDTGEVNFGIGEGPRKHQRYILLANPPSPEERALIREQVRTIERARGCNLEPKPPQERSNKYRTKPKRGYFNYYLWDDAEGSFGFVMSPSGKCLSVENGAETRVWSKEGGRKAKPRFFETLEYALLAVSAFAEASWEPRAGKVPASWETDCEDILQGLVEFANGVYGRKMVLLDPEGLGRQRVRYTAHRFSGTELFRVHGRLKATEPTPVRISGFKGKIWVDSFSRQTYVDAQEGRILKDEIEVSFGVERKKKIFALAATKNIVRVSLVDDCVLKCPDTEDAILMAYRHVCPP